MDQQTIESFRLALINRARVLLRRRRQALDDEMELRTAREPDWEDLAADQTAASLMASLSETERIAVERIQVALEKIAGGSYGECVVCHAPIDEERLRAVPEADRCGGCTNAH
jgi:DnaK suppressor protein